MQIALEQLVDALPRLEQLGDEAQQALVEHAKALRTASPAEIERVLAVLLQAVAAGPPSPERDRLLAVVFEPLWQRFQSAPGRPAAEPVGETALRAMADLYRRLGSASRARHHLLRALAAEGTPASLAEFAELVAQDPPGRFEEAALAFAPLLVQPSLPAAVLFPRLLDALEHPSVAALVLDVANHLTRRGQLPRHPAAARAAALAALFGGLVERLRQFEEAPARHAASAAQLQQQVAEAVSLLVPLCDALALVGDAAHAGKLHQALGLGHRRLRAEAASALARLGDEAGTDALVELAAEPVVRNRVLEDLEALGELERVPEELRSPAARAEGELVAWLAHPSRFGLAPHEIELVDQRTLYWPGYAEPVECFLFSYDYHVPQGDISGVGMAGPVVHAFYADLQDLAPLDIYAAYAGWFAEHEEIRETDAAQLDVQQQSAWEEVERRLEAAGFQDVRLVKLAHFFSQDIPVALARREGEQGVVIVEGEQIRWLPVRPGPRALGPAEAYYLFKGRKMLQAFNPLLERW